LIASLVLLTATLASPIGTSYLASTLLALLAILALIIGLAWLLKRLPSSALRSPAQLKIITHLNLGQRERLVVVEVGHQQLLLGITSQQINCLHKLAEPLSVSSSIASKPVLPKFSQFMQKKWPQNTTTTT